MASRIGLVALALLSIACASPPRTATPAPSSRIVYLVRHAEKADASADPELSAAGAARAAALHDALRDAGIASVIVTNFRRTQQTAQPLASALGIVPTTVAAGSPTHVAAVAGAIRAARTPVLVVGHSNTIPAIISALGGPAMPDICDAQYANLYVLVLSPDEPARLARTRFGAADPDDPACAAMRTRE